MYVKWGNYRFPDNACEVTTTGNVVENDAGVPLYLEAQANVTCLFISTATSESTIQSELSALDLAARSALSVPFQDFGLYHDNDTLSSCRIINTANMLQGTRVVSVNAPSGRGAEYASYRTLQFTVRAAYLLSPAALIGPGGVPAPPGTGTNGEVLRSWNESLTFIGNGGPRVILQDVIDGSPVEQVVTPATKVRVVQSGTAVGFIRPPLFPAPIFGTPVSESVQQVIQSPVRTSQGYMQYPISWSYEFESPVPLTGMPTFWR